jgi:hypothetical protein
VTGWLRRLLKSPKSSADGFSIKKTGEFKDRAEADQAVIAHLASLGADMSLPRRVNHYFYFANESSAREVERLLVQQGFAVEKRHPAARHEKWSVFASHEIVVSAEQMDGLTLNLERLAGQHEGEYDGWEAALKSD